MTHKKVDYGRSAETNRFRLLWLNPYVKVSKYKSIDIDDWYCALEVWEDGEKHYELYGIEISQCKDQEFNSLEEVMDKLGIDELPPTANPKAKKKGKKQRQSSNEKGETK